MSMLPRRRDKWDKVAILFILPYIVYFSVFNLYPLFMAFWVSLNRWNLLEGTYTWIGSSQYQKLFHDPVFFQSLKNNFVYIGIQVPISILGGILLGKLLNQKIKARGIFRTIYFLPAITSVVILGIIWSWMYQTGGGIFNFFLSKLGIAPVPWLTSPQWSMPSIAIMKIWTDIAFYGVLFLAAMQSLPSDVIEAARVDGVNGWNMFWRIEIPLLSPTIAFSIVMGTIWGLNLFTEPLLMTGGGPVNSSQTITLYLYREGFTWGRYSYACVIGVVSALIVFVIAFVQRKLTERLYF